MVLTTDDYYYYYFVVHLFNLMPSFPVACFYISSVSSFCMNCSPIAMPISILSTTFDSCFIRVKILRYDARSTKSVLIKQLISLEVLTCIVLQPVLHCVQCISICSILIMPIKFCQCLLVNLMAFNLVFFN